MPRFLRQFGLRTLLLFCTLAAVGFGIWRWHIVWVDRQYEIASQINDAQGSVSWETWGPGWLHSMVGSRYFSRPIAVSWDHRNVNNQHLELLRELTTLEKLYVPGNPIDDEGMMVLDHLPNLRVLAVWSTQVSDKTLERLGQMPHLEKLDIQRTQITEEGLKHLSSSQSLTELLISLKLTDNGLAYLNSIPNLKTTALRCQNLSKRGSQVIQRNMPITYLNVDHPQGDDWVEPLIGHTPLRTIEINDGTLTDQQCRKLLESDSLEVMTLFRVPISAAGLVEMNQLPQRGHLALRGTQVTPGALLSKMGDDIGEISLTWYEDGVRGEMILRNRAGWRLVTWQDRVQQVDMHAFQGLPHVRAIKYRSLEFPRTIGARMKRALEPRLREEPGEGPPPFGIDDEALRNLATLPALDELRIDGLQAFTVEGLKALAESKSITTLAINSAELGDEHLKALSQMTNLQRLSISDNSITSEGLKHLVTLKNLTFLDISHCQELDSEAGRAIAQIRSLESLEARETRIGDAGWRHLSGMPKLSIVMLGGQGTTSAAVTRLRSTLPAIQQP